jgi:hypothetical protein
MHSPSTHHPKINCLPLPACLSSLLGPYFTQLSTFPRLRVNQCIDAQLLSHIPPNGPRRDRPPSSTPPISSDHGHEVHLQTRSITASKCISKLARARPLSASLSSTIIALKCISKLARLSPACPFLIYTISASKCISKFARSQPPSASPNSLDHCLQVHV